MTGRADPASAFRPANPLSGLWSFLVGGALVVAMLAYARPVTSVEECPNYGGNGNASVFPDPSWEGRLVLALLVWFALVVLEQVLPITWRGRGRLDGGVRAAVALLATGWCSCCLFGPLLLTCH